MGREGLSRQFLTVSRQLRNRGLVMAVVCTYIHIYFLPSGSGLLAMWVGPLDYLC